MAIALNVIKSQQLQSYFWYVPSLWLDPHTSQPAILEKTPEHTAPPHETDAWPPRVWLVEIDVFVCFFEIFVVPLLLYELHIMSLELQVAVEGEAAQVSNNAT